MAALSSPTGRPEQTRGPGEAGAAAPSGAERQQTRPSDRTLHALSQYQVRGAEIAAVSTEVDRLYNSYVDRSAKGVYDFMNEKIGGGTPGRFIGTICQLFAMLGFAIAKLAKSEDNFLNEAIKNTSNTHEKLKQFEAQGVKTPEELKRAIVKYKYIMQNLEKARGFAIGGYGGPGLGAAQDYLCKVFQEIHLPLTDIALYMGIDPNKTEDQEKLQALRTIQQTSRTRLPEYGTAAYGKAAESLAAELDKLLPSRNSVYGI